MELTSTVESAFETLFLNTSPTPDQIADARRVLSNLDGAAFTSAAMRVLPRSGPKPTRVPTPGSTMWFRRDRSRRSGWQFLVAAPQEHSYRQVTWWLTTDGLWLQADQSFQRSAFQMTNTAPIELNRARLEQLLSSRSSRVNTWLTKPRGRLNAGVE